MKYFAIIKLNHETFRHLKHGYMLIIKFLSLEC
jgi:hypothetical protein